MLREMAIEMKITLIKTPFCNYDLNHLALH